MRFWERKMAAAEEEGSQSENKNDDPLNKSKGKPFSTMHQVRAIFHHRLLAGQLCS